MHELSIALSIIELAQEEARRHGAVQVKAVHLKLGLLSGVVQEALRFSYGVSCDGTMLEGSRLVIKEEPVVIYCDCCEAERSLDAVQNFFCPDCGTPAPKILRGRELELVALEIQ